MATSIQNMPPVGTIVYRAISYSDSRPEPVIELGQVIASPVVGAGIQWPSQPQDCQVSLTHRAVYIEREGAEAEITAWREARRIEQEEHDRKSAAQEAEVRAEMATTTVREIARPVRNGPDGPEFWQVFEVQRRGHSAHRVRIQCSIDGTPQDEICDCPAWKHSGSEHDCRHVTAVYLSGLLGGSLD